MKRKIICILLGLVIAVGLCYLLWPHSFADLQPECDSITVFRIDTAEYRCYAIIIEAAFTVYPLYL